MENENVIKARNFICEVQQISKKYNLPYFIVTDGASAIDNNGCEAVENARNAHIEWEKLNGIDPYHDWLSEHKNL
jgi:hypothetical protein